MIKNQKSQWQGSQADQTYGTDSQNQYRSSYRSSANPYGNMRAGGTLGQSLQNQSNQIQGSIDIQPPQQMQNDYLKSQKTMNMVDANIPVNTQKIAA